MRLRPSLQRSRTPMLLLRRAMTIRPTPSVSFLPTSGSSEAQRAWSSENSKANRIETGERSGGTWENLFGGSRRKIAKNKRCYATTLRPRSRMLLKGDKGGLGGHYPPLGHFRRGGWGHYPLGQS